MQERRPPGVQRLALVEPDGELLLLAQHLAQIEVGELRVEVVDDRQPAERRASPCRSAVPMPAASIAAPELAALVGRVALAAAGDEGVVDVVERRVAAAAQAGRACPRGA